MAEIVGWTLDRTAGIPKSQRFTFGQRLDNLALDAFQRVVTAVFSGDPHRKLEALSELLLAVEQQQALWRLVQERRWISLQQLNYIGHRLDEAGRMAAGWRRQQARKESDRPVLSAADGSPRIDP